MVLIADKSDSPLIKEVYLYGSKKHIVVEVKFTVQYFWSKFLTVSRKTSAETFPLLSQDARTLSPSLNRLGVFLNVRPSIFETERDAQQQ